MRPTEGLIDPGVVRLPDEAIEDQDAFFELLQWAQELDNQYDEPTASRAIANCVLKFGKSGINGLYELLNSLSAYMDKQRAVQASSFSPWQYGNAFGLLSKICRICSPATSKKPLGERHRATTVVGYRVDTYEGIQSEEELARDLNESDSDNTIVASAQRCWENGIPYTPGFISLGGGSRREGSAYAAATDQGFATFWKAAIVASGLDTYEGLETFSSVAFPHLRFCDESWATARNFAGDPSATAPKVYEILSGLDECAEEILGLNDVRSIMGILGSRGINASTESPGTRSSTRLMRQRDATYCGQTIAFDWHAKLERHRNRIYFRFYDGSILIGKMTEHFDT